MKKILALHSSRVFFKKEAPNFYEWICGRRGLSEPYRVMEKEYCNGERGPRFLYETSDLAISGLTEVERERCISKYFSEYQSEKIIQKLRELSKNFRVMIFLSFPKSLS